MNIVLTIVGVLLGIFIWVMLTAWAVRMGVLSALQRHDQDRELKQEAQRYQTQPNEAYPGQAKMTAQTGPIPRVGNTEPHA